MYKLVSQHCTALQLLSAFSEILNRCFQISINIISNDHEESYIIIYKMMQAVELEFNRYRNPPDFEIVQLHHDAAFVYDEKGDYEHVCPCCLRKAGSKKIPICADSASFLRISPEIPLYFSYIKVVIVVLFLFMAALGVQRMFSATIEVVKFNFTPPSYDTFQLQIGFIQQRRQVRFAFFLIFVALILLVRGYLKKSKYEVNIISKKLSDRSVMLTNVKRNVKVEQILQKFNRYHIENVELTYKVKDYIENLQTVYKLKKTYKKALKKRKSQEMLSTINKSLLQKTQEIRAIKNKIKSKENRLDFVFVTFRDEENCRRFMKKHSSNLFWRLYFKFSTCCSNTAINGQHINVFPGPEPEDVDWLNLETSYWVKKVHRFACYYMSFAILIFGIMLQYEITTFPVNSLYVSIIKNLVVFIGNFLVVNLLEFTTYQVEKHELNTHKVLSLIKKLTFFVFLNLSMSPFSIYLYYQFSSTQVIDITNTPFDQLCLSILIICIGNITKPLTQYFNVSRIVKRISFYYQRYLGQECKMTQEQANSEYEPIPFPLASFYSLLLSALFFTSFFLSSFQLIIIVQIFSCLILYVISKYMLLRVCKEPIGLNHIISILCQKLIMLCIPFYWIGDKIMYFLYVKSPQHQSFQDYLYDLLEPFTIIEMSLIVFIFLFSAKLLSKASRKAIGKKDITDSFIQRVNTNENKMTYADVNSIKQLQEELTKYIELESD